PGLLLFPGRLVVAAGPYDGRRPPVDAAGVPTELRNRPLRTRRRDGLEVGDPEQLDQAVALCPYACDVLLNPHIEILAHCQAPTKTRTMRTAVVSAMETEMAWALAMTPPVGASATTPGGARVPRWRRDSTRRRSIGRR